MTTALIMNTAELSGLDLFKLIAAEFRLEGPFQTKADYLIALNQFLLRRRELRGPKSLPGFLELENHRTGFSGDALTKSPTP